MRRIVLLLIISLSVVSVFGQKSLSATTSEKTQDKPHYPIRNWRIDERYGQADTIAVDTIITSYQDNTHTNNYSIANSWNGNLGSPMQSKIYFDRTVRSLTMFSSAYDAYTVLPEDVRYYDSKSPFSQIVYRSAFPTYREEDYLKLLLTMSVNRHVTVGGMFDYIYGRGQYANQSTSLMTGGFWAS